MGLGWGRGKPESSSSPVAVQSDFSHGHMLWIFLALLISAISAHLIDTEPSCRREDFFRKVGFARSGWQTPLFTHCAWFSMFSAWSLFPPTDSAAQKPFNGSSQCRGSGRHGLVGLWYGKSLWLTGLQHHFPSVPCVLLRDGFFDVF